MAAALTGTMNTCIKKAVEHASTRVQFGQKIDTFGAIQEKIARMALRQYVTESMAYMISANMDRGAKDFQIEAAISKVYASEAAWYCADEAIQILGGMGYMRSCGLERVMRDLRIFRIFEGTNDILRLFVALTGMQYTGKYLKEAQKALKNPMANVGAISSLGSKMLKRKMGMNSVESLTPHVHPELSAAADQTTKAIGQFGGTVEDLLIKHGKKITDQQFVLNRVAEASIDIYGMVAVLSRATRSLNAGLPSALTESAMCQVFCGEAAERVSSNLKTATSGTSGKTFKQLASISQDVVNNGGPVTIHPLGF